MINHLKQIGIGLVVMAVPVSLLAFHPLVFVAVVATAGTILCAYMVGKLIIP